MANDKKIWIKYISKNNTILSNNYYWVIIWFWAMGIALFFLQPTTPMIVIGVLMAPLYLYLWKQKYKNIVTSVTLYNYQVIFKEILFNSFKLNKDLYNDIMSIFKKK